MLHKSLVVLGAIGFFSAGIFADHTTFLIIALGMLGAGIIASIPTFWTLPPNCWRAPVPVRPVALR